MGWFKQKVLNEPQAPTPPSPAKREEYIESIRWKGEIYCRACKAELKRLPIEKKWYEAPTYDPFDGHELSFVEQYGTQALMACSKYETERTSPTRPMYYPPSFQELFERMEHPRHGLYYVDTPPL